MRRWNLGKNNAEENIEISFISLVCLVIVICAWSLLSGIGGMGFSFGDILDGDAVIYDLCNNPWPLNLHITSDSFAQKTLNSDTFNFVYYLGFYLPCAWVGSFFGDHAFTVACWCECMWTLIGVVLSSSWFILLWQKNGRLCLTKAFLALFFFVFFRANCHFFERIYQSFYYIFHWGNSITLLYMSPQHTLSAWLAAAMGLAAWRDKIPLLPLSLVLASLCIITPFTLVGMFFFFLIVLIHHVQTWDRQKFVMEAIVHLVLAIMLFLPAVFFISANSFSFPMTAVFSDAHFSWSLYLYGLIISIGLPVALLAAGRRKRTYQELLWLGTIFFTLLFSTLIHIGFWNDFPFRVSTCPLFLLCIELATILKFDNFWRTTVFWIITLFSGMAAFSHARFLCSHRNSLGIPPSEKPHSFLEIKEAGTLLQRQGNTQAFFFRHIGKGEAKND